MSGLGTPGPSDTPWRRLDARMLLVHPVNELVRFLPAIVGVAVVGSQDGPRWWQALVVVVPIVLGLLRYLSTGFRVADGQLELRRGLLNRSVLTAPLDRVRAVELTSSPIHRLLGLATVQIGTGATDRRGREQLNLDALALPEARRMRAELLHRAPLTADGSSSDEAALDAPAAQPDEVLMRLDPGWLRYAPLSTSGLVLALGAVAAVGHSGWEVAGRLARGLDLERTGTVPAVLLGTGLVALLLAVALLAVVGYLLANWGFVLARDPGGRSYHLRRGLLTSRETSIDTHRLRGVELREPLSLRLAGAAELSAVITGLDRREAGSATLVPPAPRAVAVDVASTVVDDRTALTMPLRAHGPAATRRRWIRALGTGGPLAAAYAGVVAALDWSPVAYAGAGVLLLGAAGLAHDRARRLGHGLTPGHLVLRGHSVGGRRDVLDRSGVIGWNLRQSWLQRRAGVVTLVATTAAGRQGYRLLDVPEPMAVALVHDVTGEVLAPFLRRDRAQTSLR